ncbi:MAG TPA: NAD-dependent epimerase/dehydratase family protein [Kiritimatiellia bacterium]|nr:NAD-dependent epimerase/dehydratase family protein [Kiritimatiellia bacterium]HPA78950.1 NAD-dependent epimerase/dehydratase family protein [Kiritimatiellia bacterium]
MSKCLVTGAAGFIGSHLCEALLAKGHEVVGLDAFIPYYPRPLKESNLTTLLKNKKFRFEEADLRKQPVTSLADGCDVIFHLAAMAGLMKSWSDLELYSSCNIIGTQTVLEAARDAKVPQVIHVSTSSVYGKEATGPETTPLEPFSPYGLTKLAAENLCAAYSANFGVPYTILRYFSVYGPRQRPDMAYNILIRTLISGEAFTMYGDGEQTRSNTFVSDCVAATMLAWKKREAAIGQVFNIGGGEIVSLNKVIAMLEEMLGKKARIIRRPARPGDQKHTAADISKAVKLLGYAPKTGVKEGLAAQAAWQRRSLSA